MELETLGRMKYDPNLKAKIIGVLKNENAKNLSDAEIDRCLGRCVATWLPGIAKTLRNMGKLTLKEVKP